MIDYIYISLFILIFAFTLISLFKCENRNIFLETDNRMLIKKLKYLTKDKKK